MIVFITYSDSFADTRVSFRRGATSATLRGRIGKKVCFLANAMKGQSMDAVVGGANNKVVFADGLFWNMPSTTITDSGDQRICIINSGRPTTYEMTIHIE